MIDGISMEQNNRKMSYLLKAQMYDKLIELEIEDRKSTPKIIAKYAAIICDARNPYNKGFLAKFNNK